MLIALAPSARNAKYAALVFCETGQMICLPLNVTWAAENAGNESRKAVALPYLVTVAQAVGIASGYLFPAQQAPKYIMGCSICIAMCVWGILVALLYIYLLRRENAKRDRLEGPADEHVPDTATYADKAMYFRYRW